MQSQIKIIFKNLCLDTVPQKQTLRHGFASKCFVQDVGKHVEEGEKDSNQFRMSRHASYHEGDQSLIHREILTNCKLHAQEFWNRRDKRAGTFLLSTSICHWLRTAGGDYSDTFQLGCWAALGMQHVGVGSGGCRNTLQQLKPEGCQWPQTQCSAGLLGG